MNKALILAALLALAACGNSATDNQTTGQVKKVLHITPLICPQYFVADISLGVMHNGTGSMSTEDMIVDVPNFRDLAVLKEVAQDGGLVQATYSTRRFSFCYPMHYLTLVSKVPQ